MLIRGGTVVTAGGERLADVLIRDGRVVEVRPGLPPEGDVIDATGQLVLPGIVDPHTHLLLDTGTARTADDFESGSLSAAAGGVTTYLDFAPQQPGQRFAPALRSRLDLIEGRSYVDYGLHLIIAHLSPGWEGDLAGVVDAGVTSAKVYTTYRDTIFYADDWTWYRLLERSGAAGFLVQVHAENDAIVEGKSQQLIDEGKHSLHYHAVARPAIAEAEAVGRGLLFSRVTGSPIYFVHLSTPQAVDLVDEARRSGVAAIAETCPHYLVLDESRYEQPDAARYVMTPPLRDRASQAQLWDLLSRGAVQSIGSDHCGFSLSQREGVDDFRQISPGIPGVETSLLLMHSFGVATGRISRSDLVRLLCTNPAKIFGLWPRKGDLRAGSDADLVIFDPRPQRPLRATDLHSRAGYTPYEGMQLAGRVLATICRGQLVFRDGQAIGRAGFGQFQRCAPFQRELALT